MSYHLDWCNWATPPHLPIRRGQHVWQIDLIVKWFSIPNGTCGFFAHWLQTVQSQCALIINQPGTSRLVCSPPSRAHTHRTVMNRTQPYSSVSRRCLTVLVCVQGGGECVNSAAFPEQVSPVLQTSCLLEPASPLKDWQRRGSEGLLSVSQSAVSLLSHRSAAY